MDMDTESRVVKSYDRPPPGNHTCPCPRTSKGCLSRSTFTTLTGIGSGHLLGDGS